MQMKSPFAILISGLSLLFIALSALIYRSIMDISSVDTAVPSLAESNGDRAVKDTVYVGVISRFSPNLIYEGYQPIMDYLSDATPYQFALRLSSSYEETISQLDRGDIQAAFLGTFLYLQARQSHPIKCLLKPLNSQFQPYFHSVLVTRADSPIQSIADLAGKRLALPSPLSFSGNWALKVALQEHGLRASDLDSVHYFGFHHTVIYEVLRGNFDAGAVKDRVAEEFTNKGIRILAVSDPIPGSPIIVKSDLDSTISNAMKTALLKIDIRNPEDKKIVKNWDPEFFFGFTIAQDTDYDQMESILTASEELP